MYSQVPGLDPGPGRQPASPPRSRRALTSAASSPRPPVSDSSLTAPLPTRNFGRVRWPVTPAVRNAGGMAEPELVDVVVVGLGVGGEEVAGRLAEAGLNVVGIERDLVGGECPYWGCVPSKMMIRAANALAEAHRVNELAGSAEVRPDWAPVAKRIRAEATDTWDDKAAVDRFTGKGGRFVRGSGRLDGPNRVRVGDQVFEARFGVVLGTGTAPRYRRSTGWPTRRTGPTTRPSRWKSCPGRCWCSAAARSGWSWRRCSPGSASGSPSSRPPTGCSPSRSRRRPRSPRRRCAPTGWRSTPGSRPAG